MRNKEESVRKRLKPDLYADTQNLQKSTSRLSV